MSRIPALPRRDFLRCSASLTAAAAVGGLLQPAVAAPRPGAAGWQLGCFTRPFAEFDFAQTLRGIAQAGFSSVGLMTVRLPGGTVALHDANPQQTAQMRQMAEDAGLKIAVTYYGGPPVAQSVQAGVDAMRKLIDNCAAVGCAAVVMGGTGSQALYDDYYTAVAQVCEHAAQQKVSLALKPHGGLNATGAQCRQAVQKVGHEAFTLWYDPGNVYYYSDGQLDPIDDAPAVAGLVTGMCVKDFLPPKNVAVNPGSGKVDFRRLFEQLKRGGFSAGPLVVETLAPGDFTTTVAHARNARTFLEEILGEPNGR